MVEFELFKLKLLTTVLLKARVALMITSYAVHFSNLEDWVILHNDLKASQQVYNSKDQNSFFFPFLFGGFRWNLLYEWNVLFLNVGFEEFLLIL